MWTASRHTSSLGCGTSSASSWSHRSSTGAGCGAVQGGEAVVEVPVAAFNQPVGVQQQGTAGRQRQRRAGPLLRRAGAEQQIGGQLDVSRALVGDEQGRRVPGVAEQGAPAGVVRGELGAHAGAGAAGQQLGQDGVEAVQQLSGGCAAVHRQGRRTLRAWPIAPASLFMAFPAQATAALTLQRTPTRASGACRTPGTRGVNRSCMVADDGRARCVRTARRCG
jgi:hypothetical protein